MKLACLSYLFSQSFHCSQDQQKATTSSDQRRELCSDDKLRLLSRATHLHVIALIVLCLVRLSSQGLATRTSIATLLVD